MTIKATCSCCGQTGEHELTEREAYLLEGYKTFGMGMGRLQDLFPNVPAWIRSGAIDHRTGGFCICPKCGEEC